MKRHEAGVTLVEVLVTLALVSLVAATLWSMLMVSSKYHVTETKKTHLQQEANRIIVEIQKSHRKCLSYTLAISADQIMISNCERENKNSVDTVFEGNFIYASNLEGEKFIVPKNESQYDLELLVKDRNNPNLIEKIETSISRYHQ